MFKSKISKVISLCCCAAILAGTTACADTSAEISSKTKQTPILFSWWGSDARHAYTMDGVDIFQEQNPDISVGCKYGIWSGYSKRQNIYMKSHEEPDVMQINYSWLTEYSPDGTGFYDLYQLSDYIDLSNYTKEELKYGEVNGRLNAIPIALNTQTMFYNKDLYDKYNLELPTTWEDFFAAARIMRKDDIYPICMGDKSYFFFILAYFEQTTGKTACDSSGNLALTTDDIKTMLQFSKRLFDADVLIPINQFDANVFRSGKAAGIVGWVSDTENYTSFLVESGANVVVGSYPRTDGAKDLGWYVKPATMYAISSTTEHPTESAKLLDYLLNSKDMALLQQTEKGIPVSKSARNALEEENLLNGLTYDAFKQISDNQDNLRIMSPLLENNNVYSQYINEANYYLYDKDTLDKVAERIYNSFYQK